MVSIQSLKEFGLFKELDDSELAKIAELCHERTLDDGALCFVQGRKAMEMHLCRNGKVDILVRVHEPWGIEVAVHTATAGEIFGWSALVEPYLYTASSKCIGKVDEIYIKGSDLIYLFEQNRDIGYTVVRNLSVIVSTRLMETREKLTKNIAASSNLEW